MPNSKPPRPAWEDLCDCVIIDRRNGCETGEAAYRAGAAWNYDADCPKCVSGVKIPTPAPIRTVQQFKASAAAWEAAMQCSTQSEDPAEIKRATERCLQEERRMAEAQHLFQFDDEGKIIDAPTQQPKLAKEDEGFYDFSDPGKQDSGIS